ncbi:MAG: hypothetical protein N838_23820 [Thiohalocapsa sp. PB-PSB1]|jgi:hypothetical protein|nr:MAG: hypothetical protein N838_23820 [Thiohalocapsa sp. PB-PSB1]
MCEKLTLGDLPLDGLGLQSNMPVLGMERITEHEQSECAE